MDIDPFLRSLAVLAAIFGVLVLLLRLRVPLWLTILCGSVFAALLTGLPPAAWPGIALGALAKQDFVFLCLMVFLILMLSGVQEATGQSRALVRGIEGRLRRPRLRLVLFPALVGLLPMPGGALFSCPMVRDTARDMDLREEKKSLINYWFRHIWELAWPLYPGYALASSLLGLPLTVLWRYTFPLVLLAFAVGWFFYLRDLTPEATGPEAFGPEEETKRGEQGQGAKSLKDKAPPILPHALPLLVTLAGAGVFSLLLDWLAPDVPGQVAFCLSLILAVFLALWQGRGRMEQSFRRVAFSRNTGRMFLLLVVIYIFKDTIMAGGLVASLGQAGASTILVCLLAVFLPLISGLLTGLMVGFVGLSMPILIGVIASSSIQEYTLPLVVAGLAAGNAGQLLSPLHVCLVVTCEFFRTPLQGIWRSLLLPVCALLGSALLWALVLAMLATC